MRRADHSPRGVLPTVLRRCVWSRNIKNGCSIYIYIYIYIYDISRLRVKNVTYSILISCLSKNGYIYMTGIVFTYSFGHVCKYKRRMICLQHSHHLTSAPELPWFRCPNICGWPVKYYKVPNLPTYVTLLEEEQFAWALVTDLPKKVGLPATEIPIAFKTFWLW